MTNCWAARCAAVLKFYLPREFWHSLNTISHISSILTENRYVQNANCRCRYHSVYEASVSLSAMESTVDLIEDGITHNLYSIDLHMAINNAFEV